MNSAWSKQTGMFTETARTDIKKNMVGVGHKKMNAKSIINPTISHALVEELITVSRKLEAGRFVIDPLLRRVSQENHWRKPNNYCSGP